VTKLPSQSSRNNSKKGERDSQILDKIIKDKGIPVQVNVFAQQHSWIPPNNGQIKNLIVMHPVAFVARDRRGELFWAELGHARWP
jgi:hypothetical protein